MSRNSSPDEVLARTPWVTGKNLVLQGSWIPSGEGRIDTQAISDDDGRRARVPVALWLVVLVALVFLAAGPAGITETYSPMARLQPDLDYTVKFDLNEIESATRQRDRADYDALLASAEELEMTPNARFTLDGTEEKTTPQILATSPIDPGETIVRPPAPDRPVTRVEAAPPPPVVAGVMSLDFDLGAGPSGPGAIQVEKAVRYAGRNLGKIGIRIDASSSIYVSKADVLRVLPEAHRPDRALEGDFVALSILRTSGVNLRYDPSGDVMVLLE